MVTKIYRKLSKKQINKGVIFTSTLSPYKFETSETITHEVFLNDTDKEEKIKRLKDDKFFNKSHFKYNIIRQ